jgi:capsular polysaccharide biosynthesis protein
MIIKAASNEGSDEKILQFFQRSLIGKLYRKFFKKIPFIRSFALWGWKRLFPFCFKIYAKLRSEKFIQIPLIKFSEFFVDRKILYPKQTILTPAPNVFPKYLKHAVVQPHAEYDFPEISIGLVENCIVVGASNSLSVEEHLIFHDLIDFTHDYTSEELHGRFIVDIEKSLVTRLTLPSVELEIDEGVVFTDAVSRNYAHFLTELLPRVFVFFGDQPKNSGITMIIDAGLHQNLMDAIELVVGTSESMIGLEVGEAALVKSLKVVSPCGYVPFEKRPGKEMLLGHSHGVFSPIALMSMRDFIQKKISGLALKRTPSRIYIRRNSEYRNVSNAAEIETLLLANGFSIIEPEKLTFLEQVEYFSNAEVVVGATGAALANLIFCAPSTRIVILIAKFKHTSYYYWQNMASACGNHVTYVLGEVDSGSGKTIHSNFKVSGKYILEALSA